jgi:CRP/FNR family cyclic AMP-dependent transcriptional regulator
MIELPENDPVVNQKLATFAAQFKLYTYVKGDFLLRSHEQPQSVFYLHKGSVRLYAMSKNGSELVLHIFRPLSFFPMMWAINNAPNTYYYEAMTDVEAYKIPKDKVLEFLQNNADVLFDFTSRAYRGIDALLAKVMYQMCGSAYGKVLAEIYIYVKRFGTYTSEPNSVVTAVISERDLAAQSGLTRETVSRELKILKDKNVLTFSKNNLTIVDIKRLEEELDSVS